MLLILDIKGDQIIPPNSVEVTTTQVVTSTRLMGRDRSWQEILMKAVEWWKLNYQAPRNTLSLSKQSKKHLMVKLWARMRKTIRVARKLQIKSTIIYRRARSCLLPRTSYLQLLTSRSWMINRWSQIHLPYLTLIMSKINWRTVWILVQCQTTIQQRITTINSCSTT